MYNKAQEAKSFILSKTNLLPKIGIVLGTGLGSVVDDIHDAIRIPYKNIPHFPLSTVQSHAGELIIGYLEGKEVLVLAGRFHFYEGYDQKTLTFPIRVLFLLGIKTLLLSNVAGGLNPSYEMGDIVLINDHINLLPGNPLRGENDERFGPRFPEMKKVYNREFIEQAKKLGSSLGEKIKEGVYLCLQGPSLETPAECKYLRAIGAELVGMSTVPEVIVANQMGMKIMAVSMVSNINFPPGRMHETTIEEVIQLAQENEPKLRKLVRVWVKEIF
jgi:purine-nucleoside phosphorylase